MLNRKTYLIIIHYVFLSKVMQLFLECRHVEELNGFLFRHKQRTVYMTNLLRGELGWWQAGEGYELSLGGDENV